MWGLGAAESGAQGPLRGARGARVALRDGFELLAHGEVQERAELHDLQLAAEEDDGVRSAALATVLRLHTDDGAGLQQEERVVGVVHLLDRPAEHQFHGIAEEGLPLDVLEAHEHAPVTLVVGRGERREGAAGLPVGDGDGVGLVDDAVAVDLRRIGAEERDVLEALVRARFSEAHDGAAVVVRDEEARGELALTERETLHTCLLKPRRALLVKDAYLNWPASNGHNDGKEHLPYNENSTLIIKICQCKRRMTIAALFLRQRPQFCHREGWLINRPRAHSIQAP